MRKIGGWVALAALVIGVAACGDDSSTSTDGSTSTSAASSSTTEGGATGTTQPGTSTTAAADLVLSAEGLGPIHLGDAFTDPDVAPLLDGAVGPGCELDAGQQAVSLKAPYDVTLIGHDGKIDHIAARGGFVTKPGGLHKGAKLNEVQAAFPADQVKVDTSGEETFGSWFVYIGPDADNPWFELVVDPTTQQVDSAGVPLVPTCE